MFSAHNRSSDDTTLTTFFSATVYCMVFLGITGNTICVIIFSFSRSLKANSSAQYLVAVSIADAAFLVTVGLNQLPQTLAFLPGMCQLTIYVTYLTSFLSGWYIVGMTVERFIVVYWPFFATTKLNKRLSQKVIAIITLLGIVINLWVCFMVERKKYTLTSTSKSTAHEIPHNVSIINATTIDIYDFYCDNSKLGMGALFNVFNGLDMVVTMTLPCLAIFALNVMIICGLSSAKTKRRKLTSQSTGALSGSHATFRRTISEFSPLLLNKSSSPRRSRMSATTDSPIIIKTAPSAQNTFDYDNPCQKCSTKTLLNNNRTSEAAISLLNQKNLSLERQDTPDIHQVPAITSGLRHGSVAATQLLDQNNSNRCSLASSTTLSIYGSGSSPRNSTASRPSNASSDHLARNHYCSRQSITEEGAQITHRDSNVTSHQLRQNNSPPKTACDSQRSSIASWSNNGSRMNNASSQRILKNLDSSPPREPACQNTLNVSRRGSAYLGHSSTDPDSSRLSSIIPGITWNHSSYSGNYSGQFHQPASKVTSNASSKGKDQRLRQKRHQEYRITILLLMVSISYLVLNLPSYIARLYSVLDESRTESKNEQILEQVFYLLFYLQFSINFMFYFIHAIQFKRDIIRKRNGDRHFPVNRRRNTAGYLTSNNSGELV